MTRTSPRRIPRRRDSSRQAAFAFLSNISLGTESTFPPSTVQSSTVPSHSVPSPFQSSDSLLNPDSFEKTPLVTVTDHEVINGNGRPSLQINTKTAISFDMLPHKAAGNYIFSSSPKTPNDDLFDQKTPSIETVEYIENLNRQNKNSRRGNSRREETATSFLTNISLNSKQSHSSSESLTLPTKEKQVVSEAIEGSITETNLENQENQYLLLDASPHDSYNFRRRRSSASTLKSESSSSSANSITSPTSPGDLISSRRKLYRRRSSTKPNNHLTIGGRKNSSSLFSAPSAPLGILAMLGYNDKKSKQRNLHENSKPSTNLETSKRPKAESFAHLLTPSNALEPILEVFDYDPTYLDNPALKTEKQTPNDTQDLKISKHRSVLSLSGIIGLMSHSARPSDLKRESNALFRQTHPNIDQSLTLSQIRKVKAKLLAAARHEDLDLEISTVAKAYAYFEKLILKKMVNKFNRRLIGAICLVLASKVNDPIGMSYSPLLESLHKHLDVTTKEITEQEFAVFAALDFELYLPTSEFMPHFERLFTTLDYDSTQDYLGSNPFYEFETPIISQTKSGPIDIK
ncbi:2091_t:CDS:10 [Dentiscutata erythropus]|uniref:2091_t:CDS:1 n=1 Tax=Dentiscutata erythropus TaxID=1348616 RepID=A0A9N8ZHB2_9GLOM|nr:2091_t:CDS:10 [Dentiscutata erythropus]